MELLAKFIVLLSIIISTNSLESSRYKTPVTVARTELKVSRSLNPEDTQTVKVLTRDGGVAQLIVKKRDAKKTSVDDAAKINGFTRSVITNWIPITSVVWSQPQDEDKSTSRSHYESLTWEEEPSAQFSSRQTNKVVNIIDSDRIPHVPSPVTIRSDNIYVKNNSAKNKKGKSIGLVNTPEEQIPTIHGIRVPDDEDDKRGETWRNARVINGELYPYESGYKPPAAIPVGELIYAKHPQINYDDSYETESLGPYSKEDNYKNDQHVATESLGPFSIQDNIGTSGDSQNVGDAISSVYGGPFTKEDNIKLSNSKLVDYIKEINAKEAKRNYYTSRRYRTLMRGEPMMEKRMLTNAAGYNSYPNSLMYTPTTATKLSPVNFNEGVRSPVLQYAHPELGVQPARVQSTSTEESAKITKNYGGFDYNNYELKPNRNLDIGRQTQNSVEYYKKDVLNYPYGSYYIKPKPEQPFWLKLSESIKDNVQNGFERMQQMTRPVFEPLMEASHKISYNLGLSNQPKFQSSQAAQKKVDILSPIAGGNILLPALGLVAGGAALGLGAAAVGRFLEPAELRALHGRYSNEYLVLLDEAQAKQMTATANARRIKRNIGNEQYLGNGDDVSSGLEHLTAPNLWSDTPCSKKLFCDVMVKQNEENVVFMEKKMNILLNMVNNPEIMASVSHHLEDVMDAVKTKDCSRFACRNRLPSTMTRIA